MIMGKVRYGEKGKPDPEPPLSPDRAHAAHADFKHPYQPWADKGDKAEQHFRGFKASQNCLEWCGHHRHHPVPPR